MQKCTKCLLKKDIIFFWKDKKKKNWLTSRCNDCRYELAKIWRNNNKDRMKKYAVVYHKDWYENNKKVKLKQNIEYNKNNPDIIKKAFEKYINKPWIKEKRNLKTKEWRLKNLDKDSLKCQRRRISIKNAYNDWSITPIAIKQMITQQKWLCNICKCDISEWFNRDHIVPLSKWWEHTIKNIQILCWYCNRKKWIRILVNNKL